MTPSDRQFLDSYFNQVGRIWEDFFKGKFETAARDRLLRPYRDRLASIMENNRETFPSD